MPQRLRRHPYMDKTHLISLTQLLLSFFSAQLQALRTGRPGHAACHVRCPFKTKENYTADYQFKCNILLHQWIPRDYESVRNKRLKSPELDTVQELVIHNLQRSQKLPGYRHIELFRDHKNGCGSRDTNIGCHDISIIKIAQTLLRPLLLPNMYENTWAIIKYVLCFCTK